MKVIVIVIMICMMLLKEIGIDFKESPVYIVLEWLIKNAQLKNVSIQ
jgi:hypothetical protein